ncbi:hypothetical protein F5877DRAFT_4915, partial [Lentinula edodes]
SIPKALLNREDKLIGYKINVVIDHKALTFLQNPEATRQSPNARWMEYLARLEVDITSIK